MKARFSLQLFLVTLPVITTLSSIGPVYSLPLAWAFRGEAVTPRAVAGSTLAVAGLAALWLLCELKGGLEVSRRCGLSRVGSLHASSDGKMP